MDKKKNIKEILLKYDIEYSSSSDEEEEEEESWSEGNSSSPGPPPPMRIPPKTPPNNSTSTSKKRRKFTPNGFFLYMKKMRRQWEKAGQVFEGGWKEVSTKCNEGWNVLSPEVKAMYRMDAKGNSSSSDQ